MSPGFFAIIQIQGLQLVISVSVGSSIGCLTHT